MASSEKKYVLFAGVNGSGKSTLYHLLPEYESMPRINPDDITRKYGSWDDISAQLRAGREAVSRLNHCLDSDQSFNQETTLCGKSILRNIERAKASGFTVEVYYIGVDSADICKDRIQHRVARGGHGVSDHDVERRYYESLGKIGSILHLCDTVFFYDNTERFTLIALYEHGVLNTYDEKLPDWFRRYVMHNQSDSEKWTD